MSNELNFNDSSVHSMVYLASAYNMLEEYLKPSHGQPTMSPEDMKLAVLGLKSAFEQQVNVNVQLIERIEELEKGQKSLRRRLFNR